MILQLLKSNGYNVFDASNGSEALKIASEYRESIDLLLTDMVMPQMSGRELAQHLQAVRPQLKVLFVSGYTEEPEVFLGVRTPDLAFLPKPFTPHALARKVRTVLDKEVNDTPLLLQTAGSENTPQCKQE